MIFVYLLVALIAILYIYLKNNYRYWEKRGVPGPKPSLLFGNIREAILLRKQFGLVLVELHEKTKHEHRLIGIFRGPTPTLLINDPDVINDITIKSFSHFYDNDIKVDRKADPLLGRHLFVLKGDEWKTTRQRLAPCFSSGKTKAMFPFLDANGRAMLAFVAKTPRLLDGAGYSAKELAIRLTLDNVAACAFGLEGKCFVEEYGEFRALADKFMAPGGWSVMKYIYVNMLPALNSFLSLQFTPTDVANTLKSMVRETLSHREKNGIVVNDFLDILCGLKNAKGSEFDELDVVGQATSFFADGYETSSTVMSFVMFELGANADAQENCRMEILDKLDGGELTYENLQEMAYLEAAIHEGLRLHPPLFVTQKLCTKPYTYVPAANDSIKKPFTIEKDTSIMIPLYGIHMNPLYYPEPEQYRPERFLPENRNSIRKSTYLAFGDGPRVCVGQKFGILQIKIGLVYLIKNYQIRINSKTKLPFEYDPKFPMMLPLQGIWINLEKITE